MRNNGGSDSKQCLSRAWTAISGAYRGSVLEAVWASDPSWTAAGHALTHTECSLPGPFVPALLPSGARVPVLREGTKHT